MLLDRTISPSQSLGRSLAQVSPTVIPLFAEAAAQLIEEKGPEEALAAALAIISGVTELKTRSLLSSIPVSSNFKQE